MIASNQAVSNQAQQLTISPINPVDQLQNGFGLTHVIVSWPVGGKGVATLSFISPEGSHLQSNFKENPLPPNKANRSDFEMRVQARANTPVGDHLCHVQVHHDSILNDDVEFVVRIQQAL